MELRDSRSGGAATAISFGALLKQWRKRSALTQEDLAIKVSLATITIAMYESGKRHPPADIVERLATLLDLHGDEREFFVRLARERRTRPISLPVMLDAFIGRAELQAQLRAWLLDEHVRLVTLKGPPGVGKTRLAIELAASVGVAFPDGIFFVDLSSTTAAEQMLESIAQALRVDEPKGGAALATADPLAAALSALSGSRALLVLDNLEQVADVGPELLQLLRACPDLRLLLTSRRELRVTGERVALVPSLACPPPDRPPDLAEARASAAVLLFTERAQNVSPEFRLTEQNCADVAAICAMLDGLPLAIELAAARSAILAPHALSALLAQSTAALGTGFYERPLRQQSLHNALSWSYELLSAREQFVFRRLGLFEGSCTLEAVEALSGDRAALDPLDALIRHSLVQRVGEGLGATRYTMLKTIRAFAAEQLAQSDDLAAAWQLLTNYYLFLPSAALQQRNDEDRDEWLLRLADEYPNLQALLSWTLASGRVDSAAQLCLGLGDFWLQSGYRREGSDYLGRVLAHQDALPAFVQMPLLRYAGLLARRQGDLSSARSLIEAALDHARKSVAYTLNLLGLVASNQGSYSEAEQFYQESMALWHTLGSKRNQAAVLNNLAALADSEGQYERAIELHEQAKQARQALDDMKSVGDSLCNLGMVALHQQEFARAQTYFEQSLQIARRFSDMNALATNLVNLGFSVLYQGQAARAAELFHESLALYQQLGDQRGIAYGLEGIACVVAGHAGARAGTLFAAASALRERINAPLPEIERIMYGPAQTEARRSSGDVAFDAAWALGRTLELDQAITTALSV